MLRLLRADQSDESSNVTVRGVPRERRVPSTRITSSASAAASSDATRVHSGAQHGDLESEGRAAARGRNGFPRGRDSTARSGCSATTTHRLNDPRVFAQPLESSFAARRRTLRSSVSSCPSGELDTRNPLGRLSRRRRGPLRISFFLAAMMPFNVAYRAD